MSPDLKILYPVMQGGYRKCCVVCDVGKLEGGVKLNKESISVKGPLVRGSEHVLCREGIYKKKLGGITCDLFTLAYIGHVCTATGISIWGAVNPYKVSSRLSSSDLVHPRLSLWRGSTHSL